MTLEEIIEDYHKKYKESCENMPEDKKWWIPKMLRLKGKIVGNLKKVDNKKSILTLEVEFPTEIEDGRPRIYNEKTECMEFEEGGSRSKFWFVPSEIIVHFHDDPNPKNVISRLTREQLLDILQRAIEDKKLKDTVLFRYQGGYDKFTKKENEIIRSYIELDTELIDVPMKKGRLLRPTKKC